MPAPTRLALAAAVLLSACPSDPNSKDGGNPQDAGSGCPALGSGTDLSSSPTADTTFTAEGSPYRVSGDLSVVAGVTLTLAPCAVVELGDNSSISVDGKLVSAGVAGKPVTIKRLDPSKSWAWIDASKQNFVPAVDLSYTVLEGGGQASNTPEFSSALRVRGPGDSLSPMLKVDHLDIEGSGSVGLIALDGATFADGSQALTIKGSQLEPIVTHVSAVTGLPDGDLTGNGADVITLDASERLGVPGQAVDAVMHKRSVPYRVGYYGNVQGSTLSLAPHADTDPAPRLTIEAGTTLRFALGTGLEIERDANDDATGSLIAQGTDAAPVTFTSDSATPAAGDWLGVLMRGAPKADTLLDHVVISYAGAEPTTISGYSCGTPPATNMGEIKGGLQFVTGKAVTRQLLTHSVIDHSGSNGVDRGWSGADVDYLATNTFTAIRYCAQTENRDANGQCPANPTCPAGQ